MNHVKKELKELYEKYRVYDFIKRYKEIIKTNTNVKYSKGWALKAGLYEPSFVSEIRVTNCSMGKEVKNPNKGYEYKYYFDDHDRIILSERGPDKKELNFYFYHDNVLEYIFYNKDFGISSISKSFYDNEGRLVRYIAIPDFYKDFNNTTLIEEHLYRYENDVTYITEKDYWQPDDCCQCIDEETRVTNMKVIENMVYYLDEQNNVQSFYPIRFKLVNGKKVNVPLPKPVPIFKIIKENMIKILNEWKNINPSVIWINCESPDLEMQYTTLKEDCEEKWNIAFYDANEKEILEDKSHVQVLEDLLFNHNCDPDDLIYEDYFVSKMIKIIKELRKEGYFLDTTAVILSDLEISENTFEIAKKINKKEIIKGFFNEFLF